MWQAIDCPTRASESDRTVVAAAMLCLFDKVIRVPSLNGPLIVTEVLAEDGGYYLSTTLCQASIEMAPITGFLELMQPSHAVARCHILTYLAAVQSSNRYKQTHDKEPLI